MKKVSGIELVLGITKDLLLNGFDGFEVHPCKVIEEISLPDKLQTVEQCEPEDADFWSVYVHLVGGGTDCIADCETERQANELVEFLKTLISRYKGE